MVTYKFICPKCKKEKLVEMKMSEYKSGGHMCECGTELKRDVKDIGSTFCTSRITGFCGKCGN